MKWKNLRRLKLETLFDKIHECDADLERRHLAVRQGAPLKEERDYINEFIIPLETISTLPGEQTAASAIVKTVRGYSQQPLRASSEARGGQRKTTV
jgi:hypothetical protein